ncbi:23548_t:CDS:1 [Gigaspora margarita]|uniref:23548_t:CDS:1 n=1 Tax=Gigaspora margarita TaxID=4874 RepID=A0ABN7WP60_GIGMA|nr:23548_t:CDS:1 [Gigaspora margarita]
MNIFTSAFDILNQISNLCCICQEPIKKPVTVLECDHILYFNCAIRFFAISENIICPVRNCQNRIKNIEAVKEDISDLAEALKPENTPKVKSFLREISIAEQWLFNPKDLSHSDTIEEISLSTAQGFFLLYKNIDQAKKLLARSEKNVIHAKKEVILSYYQLGKADAEKLKELLKILTPLCTAQNKIVANIKKLLPSDTSINVIRKVLLQLKRFMISLAQLVRIRSNESEISAHQVLGLSKKIKLSLLKPEITNLNLE